MGVQFRWYSGESDVVPTELGPPRHRRRVGRWLALLGLSCLFIVGAVRWQSQQGLRAIRADIQRVVDREILALQTGQREAFLDLLDPRYGPWLRYHEEHFERQAAWYAARPEVRAHVESVRLGPDLAVAQVRLRDQNGGQTEPVDWYYRRVRGRWRHAPPAPELLGPAASVETSRITDRARA